MTHNDITVTHNGTQAINDWALFHPFDSSLWIATILFTLVTAALMVAIDQIINVNDADERQAAAATAVRGEAADAAVGTLDTDDDAGSAAAGTAAAAYSMLSNYLVSLYHAGAMLLGGEDYEWISWFVKKKNGFIKTPRYTYFFRHCTCSWARGS